MNSAHKKTEDGLINKYKSNLESRIEKGDRSLVCRDEELCKEVEMLLRNGSGQKIHSLRGLDSLAVMEKSLSAFPSKTGQVGLEKLSKAFEVLELAALNLHVYPWRREYRLVKMFSGMFTHSIKPALTLQQAKELFGLLGYQASSLKGDEELALNSKLVPADFLLSFACGFFTARMECQLLLSALGSADRGVDWALQLVKERQLGLSLQVALENTKRKSDAASVSDAVLAGGMDAELDLYTEQADASHVMSTSYSPPHSSYTQPKEIVVNQPLHKEPSQSDMGSNEDARHRRSFKNPGLMENASDGQAEGDAQKQEASKVGCSCVMPNQLYIYHCEQCKDIHSLMCSRYTECVKKEHSLVLCSEKAVELYLAHNKNSLAKEKSKDSMKTHYCVDGSTSDSFLVCYDCQCIHDHTCNVIKMCNLNHNVKPTGKVQPPQGEKAKAQKRHTCLSAAHHKQYFQETGHLEKPCAPIPYHDYCWKGRQVTLPESVCLTCKVFHFHGCPEQQHCSQKHNIQNVSTYCAICFSFEFGTLQVCRYCGAVYCKRCCFEKTMICKCGESFCISSDV